VKKHKKYSVMNLEFYLANFLKVCNNLSSITCEYYQFYLLYAKYLQFFMKNLLIHPTIT
jgi:hypothetical protein